MGKHKDTHIQSSSSRRKESKEKKLRKEERGSRKVRKHRHNSSYSVSSSESSEDEISNKSKEKALGRKRKREKRKGGRERSDSKRKRREKSFSSVDEESSSSQADSFAKTTELAFNALDMVVNIVKQFPEIAAELEQLLHVVDSGQVVDISALPDKKLVFLLQKLFRVLKLRRLRGKIYALPKGGHPTSKILGPFWKSYLHKDFAMNIDDIHSLKRLGETKQSMEDEAIQAAESNDDKSNGQKDGNFGGIGPAEKPIHDANLAEASDFNSSIMNRQRFVGPAAPSKEQLAAAARLSEAESILREAEDELEQNPFVGPPPPAAVAEAESANEAERFEEVARILSLESGNAYELLGAKPDSSVEVIKKRYWKLSLLVHPDKCAHPQAQQAFTAVNRAFKDIEDPTKRAEIDRKLAEKQMREEYEEELKSLREAAHWRRLRGEPLEGDDDLLGGGTTVAGRDEWMTSLPPERKAGAPSMHSTFFSKSGREGRGDTSSWTDNPLEKAEKAKLQYLEAYKHAALTAAEDAKEIVEKQKTSKIAELVDKYNENKRPRSLLEEHKLKTAGKPQKVAQKTPGTQQDDWAGKHPWKPWDRDKDLMAGRKPVSLDAKIMGQGLSSRFSSSGSERKFL